METDCKGKDRLDNCVHWFPELVEQSVKQVRRALLHLCTAKRITSILTANKFISFSQVLLEWLSSYTKTSFTFPRVFILSPSTPRTPLLCSCAKNCRQNLANYLLKKKKESFKLSAAIRKAANRDHSVLDMATAAQDTELLPWHLNASLYTSCIMIVLLAIKIQSFPGN